MSHEQYVQQRSRDVLQVVQRAVDGTIGLLLAVREINAGLHELPEPRKSVSEEDFLFLTGVDSECAGLPLGTERQYWAPESVREKDMKAESYERGIREDLLSTFARIASDLKQLL